MLLYVIDVQWVDINYIMFYHVSTVCVGLVRSMAFSWGRVGLLICYTVHSTVAVQGVDYVITLHLIISI